MEQTKHREQRSGAYLFMIVEKSDNIFIIPEKQHPFSNLADAVMENSDTTITHLEMR